MAKRNICSHRISPVYFIFKNIPTKSNLFNRPLRSSRTYILAFYVEIGMNYIILTVRVRNPKTNESVRRPSYVPHEAN